MRRVNKNISVVKSITAKSSNNQILKALTKEGTKVSAKGSSNLHDFSYDEAERILSITFIRGGRKYEYFGVPKMIYEGLVLAPSRGIYFNQYIKHKYKQAEI